MYQLEKGSAWCVDLRCSGKRKAPGFPGGSSWSGYPNWVALAVVIVFLIFLVVLLVVVMLMVFRVLVGITVVVFILGHDGQGKR